MFKNEDKHNLKYKERLCKKTPFGGKFLCVVVCGFYYFVICDSNTSLASHYVQALLKMYPYANFKKLLDSRPSHVTYPKEFIFNEKFNHTVESYAIAMENKKKKHIESIAERRSTRKRDKKKNNENREMITGKAKRQKRMSKNAM